MDAKVPRDLIYDKISMLERAQYDVVCTNVGNEVTVYSFSSLLSAEDSVLSSSACSLSKQRL